MSPGTEEARFGRTHRWRVLAVGVAANASFAIALAGIPATAVFMRAGYRLGTGDVGAVLGALGLGAAVSELPWGIVADRLGDRSVLLGGLGGTGLLLGLMAAFVSPTPPHIPTATVLALGLLLVGAVGGSLNGASGRAIMRWFHDGERGFAMSVRQTALPAGGALGALLLPAFAQRFGFAAVYGAIAAFCVVTGAFAWAWLHEPPAAPPAVTRSIAPAAGGGIRPFSRDMWRILCGLGALCVPQITVVVFAAVFLHDVAGLGTAAISGSIVAFQVAAACARIWSGRLTDRRRNRRPFLKACAMATAALFASLAACTSILASFATPAVGAAALAALVVLGGTAAQAWHGIAYTEIAVAAGASRIATALGLANTFAFGMYSVMPLAVPALLAAASWAGLWFFAAACALLASLLFPGDRRLAA